MVAAATALAFVGGGGCAGDEDQSRTDEGVNAAYQELATQLQNCASNALACLGAADCNDGQQQICKDQFFACREETRGAYRAFHDAVHACLATKWQCVSDAGWSDAGAAAREACRDQFKQCVVDNRPLPAPAGPCMQGLRECVQADAEEGARPSHAQVRDCLIEAHACVLDRLPMCGPDGGSAGRGAAGRVSLAGTGGATLTAGTGGSGF